MTVRELINDLMNLKLDKEIYLCELNSTEIAKDKENYFILKNNDKAYLSNYEIKTVELQDLYHNYYNIIVIGK